MTFLIAHTCPAGHNTAQTKLSARNELRALVAFGKLYPERTVTVIVNQEESRNAPAAA